MNNNSSDKPLDNFRESVAVMRDVVSRVRPDQLSLDTPCASWTVADLISHVVNGSAAIAAMLRGEQPGAPVAVGATDFVEAYDAATQAAVEAFAAPGALDQVISMGPLQAPGAMALALRTTDTLVHAWDLAKATGQSTDLAPALSEAVLAGSRAMMTPERRGADGQAPFGAEQPAGQDACAADRLAAFLGRAL
jgi:uncharacterized protein (TIGR03086 family)